MTLTDLAILLVCLMSLRFRPCPKSGPRLKKRRKLIAKKATFETYSNRFKVYKTDPPEEIIRKAEGCRAEQRAANNPAEIRFASIIRQVGAIYNPETDYQRIFYLRDFRGIIRGYFVPDFPLEHYRVVFHVDGKCHLDSWKRDQKIDAYLASIGYKPVRILAADIFRRRTDVALLVKRELGL